MVGAAVFFVMTGLGEMAAFLPMSNGFGRYATLMVDPAFGLATGWDYFFKYIIAAPTNLTAAGLIIQYWRPHLSVAIWVAVFSILSSQLTRTTGIVQRFIPTIDGNPPGGWVPQSLEPTKLYAALASLKRMGISKFSTFSVHEPDVSIPPEIWLPTTDRLYKEGVFASFGISNLTPADEGAIHALCMQFGLVRPTYYQGKLTVFAQKSMFPTPRKLGMAFSAYSPLAGGFLERTSAAELAAPETDGRFAIDPLIRGGRVLLDWRCIWLCIASGRRWSRPWDGGRRLQGCLV